MRDSVRFHTICEGGVAGALVKPNRPVCASVQGDRGTNAIGSTWAIVSPETATHDIAHADSGSFVVGASFGALAQSIVADATGEVWSSDTVTVTPSEGSAPFGSDCGIAIYKVPRRVGQSTRIALRRLSVGQASPLPCLSTSPAKLPFVKKARRIFYDVGDHALACRVCIPKRIEPSGGLGIDPHVNRDIAIAGYSGRALKGRGLRTIGKCGYGCGYADSGDRGTRWEACYVANLA